MYLRKKSDHFLRRVCHGMQQDPKNIKIFVFFYWLKNANQLFYNVFEDRRKNAKDKSRAAYEKETQ